MYLCSVRICTPVRRGSLAVDTESHYLQKIKKKLNQNQFKL